MAKLIEDWRIPNLEWLPALLLHVNEHFQTELILPFPEIGAVVRILPAAPLRVPESNAFQIIYQVLDPTGEWNAPSSVFFSQITDTHRAYGAGFPPYDPQLLQAVPEEPLLFRKKFRGTEEQTIDPWQDQRAAAEILFREAWPSLHGLILRTRRRKTNPLSADEQNRFERGFALDCLANGHAVSLPGEILLPDDHENELKRPGRTVDGFQWFVICNWTRLKLFRLRPSEIIEAASRFLRPKVKADTLKRSLSRWNLRTCLLTGPRPRTDSAPTLPDCPKEESPLEEYMRAAPGVQVAVGRFLLKNTPPDPVAAGRLFHAAARAGFKQGMYELFLLNQSPVFSDRDAAASRKWLEKAAKHKHPLAVHELAKRKLVGSASSEDLKEGKRLLRAAARASCTEAQFELGRRLLEGDCFRKCSQKGWHWLIAAATRGHVRAQFMLGSRAGSAIRALAWLSIAAAEDENARDQLNARLSSEEIFLQHQVRIEAAVLREVIQIVRETDQNAG